LEEYALNRQNEINQNIKERIFRTAGKIFSEKGFRKSSVREICQAAKVNVAAINYYFTNKENLYIEVVKYWQAIAFDKFPFDFAKNETNPPEKRLENFIRSQLLQTLYQIESPWFGALMSRESIEPTRAIEELTKESLGPSINLLFSIVKQMMGQNAPDNTVHYYCASILGQCTFYHFAPNVIKKYFTNGQYTREDINSIAEHIYAFSMSAINSYHLDSK
jgi:AcrR family transcriptional regulator